MYIHIVVFEMLCVSKRLKFLYFFFIVCYIFFYVLGKQCIQGFWKKVSLLIELLHIRNVTKNSIKSDTFIQKLCIYHFNRRNFSETNFSVLASFCHFRETKINLAKTRQINKSTKFIHADLDRNGVRSHAHTPTHAWFDKFLSVRSLQA